MSAKFAEAIAVVEVPFSRARSHGDRVEATLTSNAMIRAPHSEVEAAVQQANEREAELLFMNVRPILLAVSVAPLLGLLGTVLGMMSAFGKLGGGSGNVEATGLASDISLALITTAIGLAIAIPLSLCVAGLAIQIRKTEDLVNAGLSRILDAYTLSLRSVSSRRKG